MPFIPIDSDLYPIDGAAHAVIPVRVFDGVQTTAEEAHAATAYAPVSQRQIAISTPSDVFRAIPILVAVDESTDFVRATLRYTSAIGAAASGDTIEIRLAVGSAIGSTTMLDVEATAESVTVEVAYASESARIVVAELQFRSVRSTVSPGSLTIQQTSDHLGTLWRISGAGGMTGSVQHLEAVDATASGRKSWQIGRYVSTGGPGGGHHVYAWPRGCVSTAATLYHLGRLTPISWFAETYTSATPRTALRGIARTSNTNGTSLGAAAFTGLTQAMARVYRRGRIWHTGPRCDGGAQFLSTPAAASDVIASALCERRSDGGGFTVSILYTGLGLDPEDVLTFTVTQVAEDGSTLQTDTQTAPVAPSMTDGSAVDPALDARDSRRSDALFGLTLSGGGGGWRDALRANESYEPGCIFFRQDIIVEWDATLVAGDFVRVDVSTDTAIVVYGVAIAESVES